tara:strand:- start:159 stop:860 length:702 start_codon:yes stop_codon:yes gene_type:complete
MKKHIFFGDIYIKLNNMNFNKILYMLPLLLNLSFGQNIGDLQLDNSASDNFFAVEGSNNTNESMVNIYSNANLSKIYVWNSTFIPTTRTFPAKISLPIANKSYTISLFSQSEYAFLKNELLNFDFDRRDIEEFESLQNKFEIMNMGTKSIKPVTGIDETVFLVFCDKNDFNCKDGLHWFDNFYANYFDNKQESKIKKKLSKQNQDIIRKHRMGVFGMLSLFTMSIYLLDNYVQ